jgi:alcohol dehydrogenase (NADP+)
MQTLSYAAQSATTPLTPFNLERRDVGKHDVHIAILYCGVCHSDLHTVRSEWQGTTYPCVPGHEIIGRVLKVGEHVKKFPPLQNLLMPKRADIIGKQGESSSK